MDKCLSISKDLLLFIKRMSLVHLISLKNLKKQHTSSMDLVQLDTLSLQEMKFSMQNNSLSFSWPQTL